MELEWFDSLPDRIRFMHEWDQAYLNLMLERKFHV